MSEPKAALRISTPKAIAFATAVVLLLGASLAVYYFVERFFIRDPRFTLYGSAAAAPTFHVQGAKYASAAAIEAVFVEDLGRSVYSIPLEERRLQIRGVDWVREASVARLWPNRLLVHVAEREPVAFITLPSSRTGLIDADGVVLPPLQGKFDLPLLAGVQTGDPLRVRHDGVARMLRVLEALGEGARDVSEIDIADPANTVISLPYQGQVLRLQMGDRNFAERFHNFQRMYPQIRQHMPDARTLDLRVEEFITAVEQ